MIQWFSLLEIPWWAYGLSFLITPEQPLTKTKGQYLQAEIPNYSLTVFCGFWATLINALFAYIGTELICVTVGETQNPRKINPIAIRRTFFRILVFYIGGGMLQMLRPMYRCPNLHGLVFVIGLIVPRTIGVRPTLSCTWSRHNLLFIGPLNKSKTGAAASPFVVATTLVGIKVLNHIINSAILSKWNHSNWRQIRLIPSSFRSQCGK